MKPRGIGSNVDIYTQGDERICHDVPYDQAKEILDAHNASLKDSKDSGKAWELVAKGKEAAYARLERFAEKVEPYVADAACSGLIPKTLYAECLLIREVIYPTPQASEVVEEEKEQTLGLPGGV